MNLNKHQIDAIINGQNVAFPPSGTVATVGVETVREGEILCDCINEKAAEEYEGINIPLYSSQYGKIQGLPAPQDGVLYLVNMLVGSRGAL